MNCEQIEPWISADHDGELDGRRRRLVAEHLADCSACRLLMAEFTTMERSLREELTYSEAPESLHERVMRQIPEPRPAPTPIGRTGSWTPGGWFSFGLVPLGVAAAWLLLAPRLSPPVTLPEPLPLSGWETASTAPGNGSTLVVKLPKRTSGLASAGTLANKPGSDISQKPPHALKAAPLIRPHGTQGRYHPEARFPRGIGSLRRLRQLRPRRWRYPLATLPSHRSSLRRWHAPLLLAGLPERGSLARHAPPAASVPRLSVVDYVLPEVPGQSPTPGANTDDVRRPAGPVQVADAGFDL